MLYRNIITRRHSSGCSENTGKKHKFTFVLPKYQDLTVKSPNEPPAPPFILYPYYADYNFIIDSTAIFYFQRERRGWLCGTGIDSSTPPDFINLKPKDLIQIPAASIKSFIDLNIMNNNLPDSRAVIAITKDTLYSPILYEIRDIFKANNIRWLFRKTTEEESFVLDYKIRKIKYDYKCIKWDSSKIRFLPPISTMQKFKPPKINNE
ncbi:MAG TPA: hypothetical protein VFC34_00815 [Puia sp.]|nr:hypothetical protein [Puia sp.]